MVNHRISSDIKDTTLCLWESGWDNNNICSILQVSQSSLYCWYAILDKFGVSIASFADMWLPSVDRLAVLTSIQELYEQHPDTYIDKLQWFLAIHHDLPISVLALQSNLEQLGLTRKLLHKVAIKRDHVQHEEDKASVCNPEHFSGTGEEFVTVDESSKNEHNVAQPDGRAPSGHEADLIDPFVHGVHYSLVAAMSTNRYIVT